MQQTYNNNNIIITFDVWEDRQRRHFAIPTGTLSMLLGYEPLAGQTLWTLSLFLLVHPFWTRNGIKDMFVAIAKRKRLH